MAVISRREFGGVLIAGLPFAAAARAAGRAPAAPVISVSTNSFRDLPRIAGRDNLDDVIRAVREAGATRLELALANLEPAPPSTAPVMGGSAAYPRRIVLTPEQIAATNESARAALRAWRLSAPPAVFAQACARLTAAGLTTDACTVTLNDSFTDGELNAVFVQARALGVASIGTPLTMTMARRVAPFAARHGVSVAIHNQVDGSSGGAIDGRGLDEALALSPVFSLKLDAGNLTASNRDAVAELRKRLPRVSYVVLKDRLRNGGASQPFGEGDTPIRGVLALLASASPATPAVVEYDYVGLRTAAEEVAAAIRYARSSGGGSM